MATILKAKNGDNWLSFNGLPDIGRFDEGKSLVVKNGQWKADVVTKTQANWNQNNKNSVSYIRNRTHYEEPGELVRKTIFMDTVYASNVGPVELNSALPKLNHGQTIYYSINDTTYKTKVFSIFEGFMTIILPDHSSLLTLTDTPANAIISEAGMENVFFAEFPGAYTLKIEVDECQIYGHVGSASGDCAPSYTEEYLNGALGMIDYIPIQGNETYDIIYDGVEYSGLKSQAITVDDIGPMSMKYTVVGDSEFFNILKQDSTPATLPPVPSVPFILVSIDSPIVKTSALIDLSESYFMDFGIVNTEGKTVLSYGQKAGRCLPFYGITFSFNKLNLEIDKEYVLSAGNNKNISGVATITPEGVLIDFVEVITDTTIIEHADGVAQDPVVEYSIEYEAGLRYEVTTTYYGTKTQIFRTAQKPTLTVFEPNSGSKAYATTALTKEELENLVLNHTISVNGMISNIHKIDKKYLPENESNLLLLLLMMGGISAGATYSDQNTGSVGLELLRSLMPSEEILNQHPILKLFK